MAIKVNGTTVINDSRALSNIASVDATTVAAMGAAGVGGQTTLLVDGASVGTGSQFEVSFTGGYRRYEVYLEDVFPSTFNSSELRVRYKDASNNLLYQSATYFAMIGSNRQIFSQNADIYGEIRLSAYSPQGTGSNGSNEYRFTFYDPYSTNSGGFVTFDYSLTNSTSVVEIGTGQGAIRNDLRQRFNSAVFYLTSGTFTGGKYSVWGVSN